jgi:hypothetical protein
MTPAILLALLQSQISLMEKLIDSQTPAQKLLMWDRYITLTAPIHALLMRLEKVTPAEMAANQAETMAALAPVPVSAISLGAFQNAMLPSSAVASAPLPKV